MPHRTGVDSLRLVMTRYVLVFVAIAALVTSCDRDEGPSRGDELAVAGVEWTMQSMPPGQEFVLLLGEIDKEDPGEVELLDLSPIRTDGFPEVARLVHLEVAPRGPTHPSVPQSVYLTYPPATVIPSSGECGVQRLVPAKGYLLRHDEDPLVRALVATTIQAVAPGEASLEGVRVTYRVNDETLFQDIPLTIKMTVTKEAEPFGLVADERRCSDGVEILSGAS